MASSIVYSLCGMCNTRCPVEIHCENGVPRWICGNSHSASGAALCPRGAASLALYADDERPQGPLIRAGERGAGQWRSVSWDEDTPVLILEDDLYQIVFNLMENGIKYNLPGGTLTVHLGRQEDNAVLTVSDTGMGIPEDALAHIF